MLVYIMSCICMGYYSTILNFTNFQNLENLDMAMPMEQHFEVVT